MTRDEARERAERLYASASESTICDAIARALLLAQAEAYEACGQVIAAAALRREAEESNG
jgi:hypothetical protein